MLRFFGAASVSCAVFVCGLMMESAEMRKVKCRDSFLSLLIYIKNMVNAHIPPERIFDGFSDRELENCGFIRELREYGVSSLCLMKEKHYGSAHGIGMREADILCEFACAFSRCPTFKDCEELCQRYISVFGSVISETREKQKSRAELYKKLSVICSAAVFVILI